MMIIGVLFLAAACAVLLREKIENFIGASIIATTIMAYIFARMGIIQAGVWVSHFVSLLAFGFVAYMIVSQKGNVTAYILTPGLLAFAVISFGLFIFNLNVDAAESPDSLYWVSIVKGIYYYDDFWKGYSIHTHPQFVAIWGYLSMKTWPEWSDMVLVATNNILKVSLFFPLFSCISCSNEDDEKKDFLISNILVAIIIAIFPFISGSDEYSIYSTDLIMGILFGMGIVLFIRAVSEQRKSFFYIALLYLSAATVMKRIAIVILAMVMLWLFYILIEKKLKELIALYVIVPFLVYYVGAGSIKYALTLLGSLLAAGILRFLVVKKSIKMNAVVIAISVCISVGVGWVALTKSSEKYTEFDQLSIAKLFIKTLFSANDDYFYVGEMIRLSTMAFILLMIGLFGGLFFLKRESFNQYEITAFGGILATTALYLIMMCYLYMTQIGRASGALFRESLLGLSRYMKIIPMIIGCYFLYLIISKCKDYRSTLILLLCIMLFCNLKNLSDFIFINENKTVFSELELAGVELSEEDNVAYIDMGIRDYFRSFTLYCFPYKVTNVDELSYTYREANNAAYVTQNQLREIIKDCNYMYINNANEEFTLRYAEMFADPDDIHVDKAVYIVDEKTGLYKLINHN
ncbi:hypothetical protein [Butyrivibrio sp. FCS006]|uniref:hypothetical protein n=1 Tax=Butyrivibrio sp. FCS006 TaxID=1280684 RepID=UPI0003FBA74C|nr:hypothetical protein [Butyrivibrio sp. FCS006]